MGEIYFLLEQNMIKLPHSHTSAHLSESLSDGTHLSQFVAVSELFRTLSDSTRIRIFWILCHCEECVVNLAFICDMSSPAVAHHLRALREDGLIENRRDGREVYYRATDSEPARLLHRIIEETVEITCPDDKKLSIHSHHCEVSAPVSDYKDVIKQIHDRMFENLSERITIDSLSREYHINPTTLKSLFKKQYGTSVAAHIKSHRMEQASTLLLNTDLSVADIAASVGYNSQSKFSQAFKSHFGILPTEYRKKSR